MVCLSKGGLGDTCAASGQEAMSGNLYTEFTGGSKYPFKYYVVRKFAGDKLLV